MNNKTPANSHNCIPITLKWGKTSYDTAELSIQPGSSALDLKLQVYALTNVPPARQKLLSPTKCWKGVLKDTDRIPDVLPSKVKGALPVTLIGSAEVLVEKPEGDHPVFVEDMTARQLRMAERAATTGEVDIAALQYAPGEDRTDGKMELYSYNRLVTGLPQKQIQDKLTSRKRKSSNDRPESTAGPLLEEVAMTMGLELRRAYVNSIDVLADGTIVSALDDGHIQMWRRGEKVNDIMHEGIPTPGAQGVDHIVAFPSLGDDDVDQQPAFATGGKGKFYVWTGDGRWIMGFEATEGMSPASLVTGSIGINGDTTFLAACYGVTRQVNPNQFRLHPHDEAGRRRREVAEEQERMVRQRLASKCESVQVWFFNKSGDTANHSVGFQSDVIVPSGGQAAVTNLAVLNGNLVCGDELGGLRMYKLPTLDILTSNTTQLEAGQLSRGQIAVFQFRCEGYQCGIACMEPLQNNILAVSTYGTTRNNSTDEAELVILSAASPLHIPNPRAISLVDMGCGVVKAILDAHLDVVHSICPLPDGSVLSAGRKMDATVRVWDVSILSPVLQQENREEDEEDIPDTVLFASIAQRNESEIVFTNIPVITEGRILKEPGYVFDMKVLPDSDPGSNVFAIAVARYNVVKIVI